MEDPELRKRCDYAIKYDSKETNLVTPAILISLSYIRSYKDHLHGRKTTEVRICCLVSSRGRGNIRSGYSKNIRSFRRRTSRQTDRYHYIECCDNS